MNKKNIIITIISVLILACIFAFARTTTTDLGLVKPTWTEEIDILDDLNANTDILEAFANDPLEFDSDLERLEDRAGAMWTGNTETGLTITYQDADNTIDAVIGADDIVETMLKAVNAPLDEEIFTYESTTGDFEWHTLAELSIQPLDAGLTSIAGLTTSANDMIYTTALDTYAIMDTFSELQAVVADKTLINEEDAITLDSLFTLDNRVVAGSLGSEIAVGANSYGVQWYYFGDNANVTGLRSRAVLKTTDAPTMTAQGAVLQASNADGIDASCLNGALIEAIGKSDTTASTISTMRGALVGTEWNAKETITDLKTLHIRTHTRNSVTEGYISGTGYLVYLENEAVGGNGQQLDAGLYLKATNVSTPYAFDYGIDLSGAAGEIATADIRLSNGEVIENVTDGLITFTGVLTGDGSGLTGVAGYTNLTSFVDQTAWRVFYSNTDGDVVELALGADGTYLKSNGAAAAPTFVTPAGSGTVTTSGSPVDDDFAKFTTATAIEGRSSAEMKTDLGYMTDLVDDTTPDLGGELDAGAHSIGFTQQSTTGDGTTTINWTLGNKFKFTFGAQNDTFTFTAPTNPCNILLILIQDGTGSRTATWPGTVKWVGGTAPTLTTGAGTIDICSFYWDGTNYFGVASLAFAVP